MSADFKLPEEWLDDAVRAMNDSIVLNDREIVAAIFSVLAPHIKELVEALEVGKLAAEDLRWHDTAERIDALLAPFRSQQRDGGE